MSKKQSPIIQGMKLFFGIFMVLVYLGMAYLMVINYFGWNEVRWLFAVVFAAYGIYRGYREFKGEHFYGRDDDEQVDLDDQE